MAANLRGHDSHGIMRVPYYLDQVAKGELQSGATMTVLNESPALLMADGHWGFGQLLRELTDRLIAKARESAVCVGTLIHSGHIGRLGEYCEQAAEAGMVSLVMVNTHGAARGVGAGRRHVRDGWGLILWPSGCRCRRNSGPRLRHQRRRPKGKVRVKKIAGQTCPDGWLLDSKGHPTNDPNTLYGTPPGTIRPMGGDQAYKGFGLALMIEVLAGAWLRGVTIREKPINQLGNCVFMLVMAPDGMCGEEHFGAEVAQLVEFVAQLPRRRGRRRHSTSRRSQTAVSSPSVKHMEFLWMTVTGAPRGPGGEAESPLPWLVHRYNKKFGKAIRILARSGERGTRLSYPRFSLRARSETYL